MARDSPQQTVSQRSLLFLSQTIQISTNTVDASPNLCPCRFAHQIEGSFTVVQKSSLSCSKNAEIRGRILLGVLLMVACIVLPFLFPLQIFYMLGSFWGAAKVPKGNFS